MVKSKLVFKAHNSVKTQHPLVLTKAQVVLAGLQNVYVIIFFLAFLAPCSKMFAVVGYQIVGAFSKLRNSSCQNFIVRMAVLFVVDDFVHWIDKVYPFLFYAVMKSVVYNIDFGYSVVT